MKVEILYQLAKKTNLQIVQKVICLTIVFINLFYVKWFIALKLDYNNKEQLISPENQPLLGIEIENDENSNYSLSHHLLMFEVYSSHNSVKVALNGEILHEDSSENNGRGLHMIILHPITGEIVGKHIFDTFSIHGNIFLNKVLSKLKYGEEQYILVFAVKDEASYQLNKTSRKLLAELGSKQSFRLKWRSLWALVCWKRDHVIYEDIRHTSNISTWPEPVHLKASVSPNLNGKEPNCKWPASVKNEERKNFCSNYVGYDELCLCSSNNAFKYIQSDFVGNNVSKVPVIVIASNRPSYLYRMLCSLVNAHGVQKNMITVFIDGYFKEAMKVVQMFDLRGIYHMPSGTGSARISQAYLSSFNAVFGLFPDSQYCIVLEEDLDVSPDIFRYFSQTISLLDDDSLYCISAWNDQGYEHSSKDSSLLYRVETMPGLGWLFKRTLFENELRSQWPGSDKLWDWDMWIRHPNIRKGRECVIPDISRTFHFGETGVNMNKHFYDVYFSCRKFNNDSNARLQNVDILRSGQYETLLHKLVRSGENLNHKGLRCNYDSVPANVSQQYIAYYRSEDPGTFLQICKCLNIWDLDVRGLHKNTFRTFIKGTPVIFVGYPDSPYSIYKPIDVTPISFA